MVMKEGRDGVRTYDIPAAAGGEGGIKVKHIQSTSKANLKHDGGLGKVGKVGIAM